MNTRAFARRMCQFLAAGFTLSVSAHAALVDRGGGLIYDTDRNITWLSDANYAATELTTARVAQIIAAVPIVAGHTLSSADFRNGALTWWGAMAWADQLSYGGFTDWRLPSSLNADGTGPCLNLDCTGSEMGHLFYGELSGAAGRSVLITGDPDLAKFSNIAVIGYWSSTANTANSDQAYYFRMYDGTQIRNGKSLQYFAWAVRTGDVAVVPLPAALPLVVFGLGFLGWFARRHRESRAT